MLITNALGEVEQISTCYPQTLLVLQFDLDKVQLMLSDHNVVRPHYENRKQRVSTGLVVQEVKQRVKDTTFDERKGEEVFNVDGGRGRGAGRWLGLVSRHAIIV
nr:hypothetical protein [Tanacetum cinerariifolium]